MCLTIDQRYLTNSVLIEIVRIGNKHFVQQPRGFEQYPGSRKVILDNRVAVALALFLFLLAGA